MPDSPDLDALRSDWERNRDGETGSALAEELEARGELDEAAIIWQAVWDADYPTGYYGLAWLEHRRGHDELAVSLMQQAVDSMVDDPDDEDYNLYLGVLGAWRWDVFGHTDVEWMLRRGQFAYDSARADLGYLLKVTDRREEAEQVFRAGVAAGEDQCYLPLGNILDESDRREEAEHIYRLGYALGDPFCAFNLGLMLYALERDDEAEAWIERAAIGGDDFALKWIAEHSDETGEASSS